MSRTMCSILDDMRKCVDTRNFSYLSGLIEEAQWGANRMEAAINDKKRVSYYSEYLSQVKEKLFNLYKTYVKRCKELGFKPVKRDVWISDNFDLVDNHGEDSIQQFFKKSEEEKPTKVKTIELSQALNSVKGS